MHSFSAMTQVPIFPTSIPWSLLLFTIFFTSMVIVNQIPPFFYILLTGYIFQQIMLCNFDTLSTTINKLIDRQQNKNNKSNIKMCPQHVTTDPLLQNIVFVLLTICMQTYFHVNSLIGLSSISHHRFMGAQATFSHSLLL